MTNIAEIVQPSGVLSQGNADLLRSEIASLLDKEIKIILIDFQDVTFMTSSGIGALVATLKEVKAAGGKLYICSLSEQVKNIFELTKMELIFKPLTNRQEFEEKVLTTIT
ncbi:MAG: STAS domain-containing protein [Xenococcaceae cyanobacterium MO_207.B15]|nr:STAS domain-containing protein [Xenococcaceae cyanobacterium MO_207.B15]MDJ0746324.1 STAS domain-containing protein [Xenococcaceae cyanobacterium MO_167.B27]